MGFSSKSKFDSVKRFSSVIRVVLLGLVGIGLPPEKTEGTFLVRGEEGVLSNSFEWFMSSGKLELNSN